VEALTVNVETNITYKTGWNWDSAKSYILKAINDYFTEISRQWEKSDGLTVRISQLESRILDCEAVLDIADTKLNGVASNLNLTEKQIPVRGTVNGN